MNDGAVVVSTSRPKRRRRAHAVSSSDVGEMQLERSCLLAALERISSEVLADALLAFVPRHVLEAIVTASGRCRLLELASALQSLIYSFATVSDHFATARCCRRLRQTSLLRSSSPHFLEVPYMHLDADAFPPSLLRLCPHKVNLATHWSTPDDWQIADLARISSIRELTLDVDRRVNRFTTRKPVSYLPFARLQLLANLQLTVGRWEDVVPLMRVVGPQLTELTLDNNIVEDRTYDFSFLLQCTRLKSLVIHDPPTFKVPLRGLRRLPECAPGLTTMTLTWSAHSELAVDLRFLSAFTCLETLTLNTGRRSVPHWLRPLPFLRSLDISRTLIPLTTLGFCDANTRAQALYIGRSSLTTGWSSLTRLVPYTKFEVQDLLCLPASLIELDLRSADAIHDTFVDMLVATPNAPPFIRAGRQLKMRSNVLPRALRRIILPRNCPVVSTNRNSGASSADVSASRSSELRQRLARSTTLIDGITVSFV